MNQSQAIAMLREALEELVDYLADQSMPITGPHDALQRSKNALADTAEVEDGWLPIESAPKDGTNILLTNGTAVAQGWWVHEEPYIREKRDMEGNYIDQAESDGFDGWMDCDGGMQPDPSHWMPIPPAPQEKEHEADRP